VGFFYGQNVSAYVIPKRHEAVSKAIISMRNLKCY